MGTPESYQIHNLPPVLLKFPSPIWLYKIVREERLPLAKLLQAVQGAPRMQLLSATIQASQDFLRRALW